MFDQNERDGRKRDELGVYYYHIISLSIEILRAFYSKYVHT